MSMSAGAMRTHGLAPTLEQGGYVPPQYRTRAFLELRNEWYRRLEGEGVEVNEIGFQPRRQRRVKGPATERYVLGSLAVADDTAGLEVAERASIRAFGEPRSVHDLETAEFWRLMSAEVAKLPECYRGKAFLQRWADIGDVKTAAADTGLSRWKARQVVDKFKTLLRQKRVLR